MEKKTASAPADTPAPASAGPQSSSPETGGASAAVAAPPPVETIRVEGVLDIDLQRGGNGQLIDINKGDGTGFLISTHDEKIAARCRREVFMVDGKVADDRR